MIEGNEYWSQLKALMEEGEKCTEVLEAKAWKARVETALRKVFLYAPEALEPKLATVLGDIQRLSLERQIYRLGGPDTIVDFAHRDQVIGLLRLACEFLAAMPTNGDSPPVEPTPPVRRQPRHGPLPDMVAHRAIAQVINQYGGSWGEVEDLEKIAAELDRRKVRLPKAHSKWKLRPRSWKRAVDYHPERVRSAIRYSVQMVAREDSPTPSTPS